MVETIYPTARLVNDVVHGDIVVHPVCRQAYMQQVPLTSGISLHLDLSMVRCYTTEVGTTCVLIPRNIVRLTVARLLTTVKRLVTTKKVRTKQHIGYVSVHLTYVAAATHVRRTAVRPNPRRLRHIRMRKIHWNICNQMFARPHLRLKQTFAHVKRRSHKTTDRFIYIQYHIQHQHG